MVLVAACSRPAGGGAAIQVTFDSTAHAEAGRADLGNACHLVRITYDDHYGLRAAQMYDAPRGGVAEIEKATACAKRFAHVQAVGVLL